ncbi:MAG: PLDc N-terminal domain-containing protein [Fulvivirga sp.]|nr:PLDc N-terminal domain-containing protein [Fulvivirga sp.]
MDLLTLGFVTSMEQALILMLVLLGFVFVAFTIYQVIKEADQRNKALWILIILFFPIVGSIIYWFNRNRERRKRSFDPFKR